MYRFTKQTNILAVNAVEKILSILSLNIFTVTVSGFLSIRIFKSRNNLSAIKIHSSPQTIVSIGCNWVVK